MNEPELRTLYAINEDNLKPLNMTWLKSILLRHKVFEPVDLYLQQWCVTHDGPTNHGEVTDDTCVLMDTAPSFYVIDPDPLIYDD